MLNKNFNLRKNKTQIKFHILKYLLRIKELILIEFKIN